MGRLKTILLFLLLCILAGCETPGDKFPRFELREKVLGEVKNHDIRKAFFLNESVGFVAVSDDTVLSTKDGCRSFRHSLSDTTCSFVDIEFTDDSTGFVLDKSRFLFTTRNGGDTWEKQRIALPGVEFQDLHCLNRDTLFISAGGDAQTLAGYILRSADGGSTWDTIETRNLAKFFFVDNREGFLCGYDGILRTTDSGMTWDTLSEVPAMDILFFSSDRGYLSFKRTLFATRDGGRSWQTVKAIQNPKWIVGEDFSRIECLGRLGTGELVFTLNSRIIKVDAAGKWSQYEFTRPYYQLQMIGPQTGIVYGFEKIILVNF